MTKDLEELIAEGKVESVTLYQNPTLPTPQQVLDLRDLWPSTNKAIWRVIARYAAGGLIDPETLDGHEMPSWWPDNPAAGILMSTFNSSAESSWMYFCALVLMAFREGHANE